MTEPEKDLILIVDDNPNNLDVLVTMLRRSGYEVQIALDGQSACQHAEKSPPDLILLDILMPGMDGFETAICLKKIDRLRETPIIFLTAVDDVTQKIKGFEVGGVDYITKPLHIKELLARINTHLTLRKLQLQAKHAAAIEERAHLARELHDSVTQTLYSLTMYADAARLALASNKQDAALEHVNALRGLTREAMRDMRLLVFELRPPILTQEGLIAAIQTRLDSVEARSGYQTTFIVEGKTQFPPEVETELYRIVQEALNNIVKHAQAQQVTVQLLQDNQYLQLTILDDGQGFDVATAQQQGRIGLRSMKERAQKLGGTLIIESTPGRGTTLRVEITV
jgi:signal transduction histidine kinase